MKKFAVVEMNEMEWEAMCDRQEMVSDETILIVTTEKPNGDVIISMDITTRRKNTLTFLKVMENTLIPYYSKYPILEGWIQGWIEEWKENHDIMSYDGMEDRNGNWSYSWGFTKDENFQYLFLNILAKCGNSEDHSSDTTTEITTETRETHIVEFGSAYGEKLIIRTDCPKEKLNMVLCDHAIMEMSDDDITDIYHKMYNHYLDIIKSSEHWETIANTEDDLIKYQDIKSKTKIDYDYVL